MTSNSEKGSGYGVQSRDTNVKQGSERTSDHKDVVVYEVSLAEAFSLAHLCLDGMLEAFGEGETGSGHAPW